MVPMYIFYLKMHIFYMLISKKVLFGKELADFFEKNTGSFKLPVIYSFYTLTGRMFHRKPLYVAIAQRKEDRQLQLQLQYAQQMAGLAGPSTNVIPGGYPPLYYTAPSAVVSQVSTRPGLMYQPLGLRAGWRANGFTPSARPAYQASTLPAVSVLLQLY